MAVLLWLTISTIMTVNFVNSESRMTLFSLYLLALILSVGGSAVISAWLWFRAKGQEGMRPLAYFTANGIRLRNSAIRLRIYGNPTKTEALLSIFDRYNNFLFCCATCPPFINWLHGYSVIRTIRSNFLTTV